MSECEDFIDDNATNDGSEPASETKEKKFTPRVTRKMTLMTLHVTLARRQEKLAGRSDLQCPGSGSLHTTMRFYGNEIMMLG